MTVVGRLNLGNLRGFSNGAFGMTRDQPCALTFLGAGTLTGLVAYKGTRALGVPWPIALAGGVVAGGAGGWIVTVLRCGI